MAGGLKEGGHAQIAINSLLADVEGVAYLAVIVLWWKGRKIPGLQLIPSQLYLVDIFHLGELLMLP